jgi:hypothetical protein
MATPAQILANQQNAQKSTGPKTPEGKAASAANATKHGLSSAFTVLAHEDQDEFDELLQGLRDEHQPTTHHQGFLVDHLAKTQWLLARAQRLEAVAFDHLAGAELDPHDPDSAIILNMFKTNPNVLATLQRHAANAERSYYKAFRELAASKKIQNEADYVAAVTRRLGVKAPAVSHPATVGGPAVTQYGHLPQSGPTTTELRAKFASAGNSAFPY